MIDKLETAMMGFNTGIVSNAAAPFGGVKQSGMGRESGFEGIHEVHSTKYTLIPTTRPQSTRLIRRGTRARVRSRSCDIG
jgi:acyl-CoA reductase-like NAD-dependent aldehyde dehydrogenase